MLANLCLHQTVDTYCLSGMVAQAKVPPSAPKEFGLNSRFDTNSFLHCSGGT
ncbi:MAG: hypothetical protein J6V68_04535 [Clostridia bacterium]|nr:hypothetical protein [Clostridia bacterium]